MGAQALSELAPVFRKLDPVVLADRLTADFDSYLRDTGTEIVDVATASMSDVAKQYLEELPPFGPKDKKHEFPDAIVISALVGLARTKDEDIYVISRDDLFRQACDNEHRLYPLNDVSDFLSEMAGHEEVASARISKLFLLRNTEIIGVIKNRCSDLSFYLEADVGDGDAELDSVEDVTFEGDPEIISLDESTATVEIPFKVTLTVEVSYEDPDTGVWDSEDHVMLFMQTKRANVLRTTPMTAEILLEFESVEDLAEPEKIDISVADLSPDPVQVSLRPEELFYASEVDDDNVEE